jgi:hypothetical protein
MTTSVLNRHGQITPIIKQTAKCLYCEATAHLELEHTTIGNSVVQMVCPNGHKSFPGCAGFPELIENREEVESAPENALRAVLCEHEIPHCFGAMRLRYDFRLSDYELRYEGKGDTVQAMVEDAIAKGSAAAIEHARQLVSCSRCLCFSRCQVLSGLTRCSE